MNAIEIQSKVDNGEPQRKGNDVAVAVITPVGTFPSDHTLVRINENENIEAVLKAAADALGIVKHDDWVVLLLEHAKGDKPDQERELDPRKSFKEENLKCIVEIEWHKREGGGGT